MSKLLREYDGFVVAWKADNIPFWLNDYKGRSLNNVFETFREEYKGWTGVYPPESDKRVIAIRAYLAAAEVERLAKEAEEKAKIEAFETKQNDELSDIPVEFHGWLKYKAWERGHSCGYDEVICVLQDLTDGFRDAVEQYRKNIIAEHNANG